VRTLVISDLHLGGHGPRVRLHDPGAITALAAALGDVDRLVLLGDILELRHASARDALAAASRVLPELVSALPAGAEIIAIPGNHDHSLGAGWALRRSAAASEPQPLGLEQPLKATAGEPLGQLLKLLGGSGAAVRAVYPGVWLRDDVYAHHGHYLDRHTTLPFFERLGAGVMARLVRTPLAPRASVEDYERVLAPLYAWMYPIAQAGVPAVDGSEGPSVRVWRQLREGSGPRKWLLVAATGAIISALNRTSLGPLSSSALRGSLDGAELPAFAAVLDALDVEAGWAIFGHTHRAGPLPGDDPRRWTTPAGVRMVNSGSWVHDDLFIDPRASGASPYRPGFAVEIVDDQTPQIVNLLDPVTNREAHAITGR
jgi:UDP-2,3-diacylglucosamine pyrophosphatase LpxH